MSVPLRDRKKLPRLANFRSDDVGSVAIVVAILLPVLLGAAGLAVDVSIWSATKNSAQGAADLAALSAIAAAAANNSSSDITAEAFAVAATNGFTNGQKGVTVTVNNPPSSGSHTSDTSAYEVIITQPQQTYFGKLIGVAPTITGRSVATNVVPSSVACILALSTTAQNSINLSGSASITANNCAVASNSTSSKALNTSGSACVTASALTVVGNYSNGSSCSLTVGTIKTNATATPDPYATLATPSISACSQSINVSGTTQSYGPGTYCGITVSGGGSLTLSAGTYYIDSGNLSVSGTSHLYATAGVSIVLTSSGSTYGTVSISGGSTVDLTASSTGPYAGIAVYIDRRASTHSDTFSGGSTQNITGAIYAPTQQVTYSGGSGTGSTCSQLVALTVTFSGSSQFGRNCSIPVSGLQTGATSGLVE